jgi:hypothetical protein
VKNWVVTLGATEFGLGCPRADTLGRVIRYRDSRPENPSSQEKCLSASVYRRQRFGVKVACSRTVEFSNEVE